jgi:hypothetical protein
VQLLVYARNDDDNGKRLLAAVSAALPLKPPGVYRQLAALRSALCAIVEPDSIAVLSAVDRRELRRLQALRGLLGEIFVVLVVPDFSKDTIRLAHLLLPRFISRQEDSFSDLTDVLRKMAFTPH